MSDEDGPPLVFDGDDFPYWKICMEAYLEAIDIGVYKATTQGFPEPRDPANLVGEEFNYEKCSAKAKNILFRGLYKDVFNRVRNYINAHDLWMDICALHEGTRSELEERYHIAMRKLNCFEMLANENVNTMYSRLNILVEEVIGLGLTQISQLDVVRKILSVLPIDKYVHIVTVLHQMDLSVATPTQILGKINAHEMYMHINDKDESSSKRKDLALKANQEKKGKAKVQIEEESSSDDDLDANIALMVRKTTKMLKKLNREGIKFYSRKKKFFSSKRKPISEMDCYNCGELGHLDHQCNKPNKNKFKGKKYDVSDDEKKEKKFFKRKDGKHKRFHKKKNGKAYIVGDWLTDIESSSGSSSSEKENDEKVTAIAGDFSSPPQSPSSTSYLCLMAKGKQKVQIDNDIIDDSDSDSDDEFASPSYDELADLLKEYTQIIRKSKDKCDKLKDENEFLIAKYDIVVKASDEMKKENKTMSSTVNELKSSLKDAKDKCDKLNEASRKLKDKLVKIKEDYTKIKIDHENLLVLNELLSCNTHEAINPAIQIDVATSCDDLRQDDQTSLHDELTEKVEVLTLDNQKLKRYLTDATTRGKVAIESNDFNNELAVDNERHRNEVKKLKNENEHLATSVQKFNKG
jgi:hypothetical protein